MSAQPDDEHEGAALVARCAESLVVALPDSDVSRDELVASLRVLASMVAGEAAGLDELSFARMLVGSDAVVRDARAFSAATRLVEIVEAESELREAPGRPS